jgi:hypothetical protein
LYEGFDLDEIIVAGRTMQKAIVGCRQANLLKNTSETLLLAPYPDILFRAVEGKHEVASYPGCPDNFVSAGVIELDDDI